MMTLPATVLERAVTATWYDTAAHAPDTSPAAHPSVSRSWAQAWEQVTTEEILAHRHLHLTTSQGSELVSYYLTGHSPYWVSMEEDADCPPVWTGPVVYAPSTYGEYGGAGASTPAAAQATIREGLAQARTWGAQALVLPHLTVDQAAAFTAAHRPDAHLYLDNAYTAPVPAGGLDAYIHWTEHDTSGPNTPTRGARQLRRARNRGNREGLMLRIYTGSELHAQLSKFTPLARQCASKHGIQLYDQPLFEAAAHHPGTLLLSAETDSGMAGALLCFVQGDCLYAWASGIDYAQLQRLQTYRWLVGQAIQWASDQSLTRIDLGRANHAEKRSLGMHSTPLHALVYLTAPDPQLLQRLDALDRGLRAAAGADPAPAPAMTVARPAAGGTPPVASCCASR